jgi:Family of unknown function (DUF6375)
MKIWRSYGSAHSADLTIVGEFSNVDDAEFAREIVEDFVNAQWGEHYPDNAAFIAAWKGRLPALPYLGPHQSEFEMGIDHDCDVMRNARTVTVSDIRSGEIGGIVKLLLLKNPTQIKITGRTGP